MRAKILSQTILLALVAAVLLPIAVCVIVALGRLLAVMGDASPASTVLDWIAVSVAVVWVLDLVSLVLLLAIQSLLESDEPPEPE